jgi:hypothetical protein
MKPMDFSGIENIVVDYSEENEYSRFGLLPLLIWYFRNVLELEKRFELLTVKSKRNHDNPVKYRKKTYTEEKMSLVFVLLILLQVERFSRIKDVLSDEVQIAKLIGLEKFFSDQTAYNFINAFQKWHIDQLGRVNANLLSDFGLSINQDFPVIDIDMTTFSLESKLREGAVPGYNKIKRGKPCYQWSVAFCAGEALTNKLAHGNSASLSVFTEMLGSVESLFPAKPFMLRLDSGYLSADVLNCISDKNLFILCGCPYNYVMAQPENKSREISWQEHDENTWLFDLGVTTVVGKAKNRFRVILVKKKQEKIKIKKAREYLFYAIVTNFYIQQTPAIIYTEYHKRQTIENFFKEIKNPFNSTKMPSALLRGNEAYLWFQIIAYNCFAIFKKIIFRLHGRNILIRQLQTGLSDMGANSK